MSDVPQVEVLYSCSHCGIVDRGVKLRARTDEEVVFWVGTLMARAISADHRQHSPHCTATKMDNVKIPMEGTDRLGGAPVN